MLGPVAIVEERREHREAVRRVNRLAFGQDDEGLLVDRLRGSGAVVASLVALDGESPVGHILFTELPIETATATIRAVSLAPMAVIPECQRRGIGSALVRRGLDLCRERGCAAVLVVGHPAYYPRFGFSAAMASRIEAPFSGDAFMALELVPGSLAGVRGKARYHPAFELSD